MCSKRGPEARHYLRLISDQRAAAGQTASFLAQAEIVTKQSLEAGQGGTWVKVRLPQCMWVPLQHSMLCESGIDLRHRRLATGLTGLR